MKVYVVFKAVWFDEFKVYKVFLSLSKAKELVNKLIKRNGVRSYYSSFHIEDFEL